MVKRLILKLVHSMIHFIDSVKVKMRNDSYLNNPNISIGFRNKIFRTAELNIYEGGDISIGNDNEIMPYVLFMTYGGSIEIGNNCSINPYTIIYGHGNTKIGNNVLIAGHCMIIPASHVFSDSGKNINEQGVTKKGIIIEDNVWIAHGCSILDGVTIGKGAVIGAGSVVNKNVAPGSVVGGIPAKILNVDLKN